MSPRSAGCQNSFTRVLARLRAQLDRVRRSLTTRAPMGNAHQRFRRMLPIYCKNAVLRFYSLSLGLVLYNCCAQSRKYPGHCQQADLPLQFHLDSYVRQRITFPLDSLREAIGRPICLYNFI